MSKKNVELIEIDCSEESIDQLEEFFYNFTILAKFLYGKDSINFDGLRGYFYMNTIVDGELQDNNGINDE